MKIETKNSLWSVMFYSGCYSDAQEYHIVVSGNTIEEVINSVKIYAIEELKNNNGNIALLFEYNNEKYLYNKKGKKYKRFSFDIEYTDYDYPAYGVEIERLNVIYTGDEIAPKNSYIPN